MIVKESFRLHHILSEAIICLVDRFFDMDRVKAQKVRMGGCAPPLPFRFHPFPAALAHRRPDYPPAPFPQHP